MSPGPTQSFSSSNCCRFTKWSDESVSQEHLFYQIIVIKSFFYDYYLKWTWQRLGNTNRKPRKCTGEKHLQAKTEKVHAVNANSLQPRGTEYNLNYFTNCGNKVWQTLWWNIECATREKLEWRVILCSTTVFILSFADFSVVSSGRQWNSLYWLVYHMCVWLTADLSVCYNLMAHGHIA